jgi:hypothetical protein
MTNTIATFAPANLQALLADLDAEHVRLIGEVFEQAADLLGNKGQDYNQMVPFLANMPFGDQSWATLCWIKAHRAASLVLKGSSGGAPVFDPLNDVLMDLVVYAAAWLAFRRLHSEALQLAVEEL